MANNKSSTNDFYEANFTKENAVSWFVLYAVLGLLIVVSNFLTIITFVINRHLRRTSVYCLVNLAVADMLYGGLETAYQLFFIGYYFLDFDSGPELFGTALATTTAHLLFTCLLSLVLVALGRVYATFFPFRHRTTRLRAYVVVFAITWTLPLPLHFYDHVPRELMTTVCIIFLLSLVIIIISYTSIFFKVKRQDHAVHQHHQQVTAIQRTQRRERDLAKTLFIVTVISVITWLPYIVMYILPQETYDALPFNVRFLFAWMQPINSLINPILYVLRMKDFRKAFFHLVTKCSNIRAVRNPDDAGQHEPAVRLAVLSERRN